MGDGDVEKLRQALTQFEERLTTFGAQVADVHSFVKAVNEALVGSIDGTKPGLVPRVCQLEQNFARVEAERVWLKRTIVASLIGMVLATGAAAFAALK